MKKPYNKIEKEIMDSLVNATNLFRKLQLTHPSHEEEFISGIHTCQNVIIHRIVQRDYPKEFPTY